MHGLQSNALKQARIVVRCGVPGRMLEIGPDDATFAAVQVRCTTGQCECAAGMLGLLCCSARRTLTVNRQMCLCLMHATVHLVLIVLPVSPRCIWTSCRSSCKCCSCSLQHSRSATTEGVMGQHACLALPACAWRDKRVLLRACVPALLVPCQGL